MTDPGMEQLKLLFQYTTFHIGLYATLIAALVALLQFNPGDIARRMFPWLLATIIFFLGAGAAGGVIASNIPEYRSFDELRRVAIGTWFWAPLTYERWAPIEHACFWLGIATAIIGLVRESYRAHVKQDERERRIDPARRFSSPNPP